MPWHLPVRVPRAENGVTVLLAHSANFEMQTWASASLCGQTPQIQLWRLRPPPRTPQTFAARKVRRPVPRQAEAQATPAPSTSKPGPVTLWTLLAISCLNLMSFTAMYPITPKLMIRYSMKSEIGVGLVASSFALGRFLTTSCWPILGRMVTVARVS